MQETVSRILLLRGTFETEQFTDWIILRANRLSLSGWVQKHNPTLIEIHVTGDNVLVDAMEVACSLGPVEVLVDRVESHDVKEKAATLDSGLPAFFTQHVSPVPNSLMRAAALEHTG